MDTSISVALSAQRALLHQLDVVANNVANANSVGFRAEKADFSTVLSNATPDRTNFVEVTKVHVREAEGPKFQTDNPLDVAISGDGYFSLQTPAGQVFTRDGRFKVSPFGELQSLEGFGVLDAGGAPIVLENGGSDLTIHPDGRVREAGKLVGNIGVFDLPEEQISSRYGNTAFTAKTPPNAIPLGQSTSLTQGYLEGSNTDPLRELANLITVQRSFDSVSSMIEKADGALTRSITELARRG
jgi:flagellar basal-body rod protein FlgF